jgi:sulfite reductase alpha subunit-like flavoprotein
MWDKIMDMLDMARAERLTAKNATLKLPVASLKKVDGEGTIKTLTYTLPHNAFMWNPGDTVAVWPRNSTEDVLKVLNALNATGDELIELSEEWRSVIFCVQ